MNKKLLTLAVGAALAGGTALAHAEATVYGHFHVSIDSLDNGGTDGTAPGSALAKGLYVSDNSSRFGVKGSEDLGGGLKALFQVENQFRSDGTGTTALSNGLNSSGGIANRNTYVGLAGDFGAVLVGRHDTPMKIVGRGADLFNEQVGDARNVTNNDWTEDMRVNNVIAYASPNMSGVSVLAAYLPADGYKDNTATSINVTYSAGPLWVGFANETLGKGVTSAVSSAESQSGNRLAAKYTAGDLTVAALWQSFNNILGVKDVKNKAMGIGAAFKAGNNSFKVQYYTLDESSTGANDGGKLTAIGVDHAFSKNTTGYIAYAAASNDPNGTVSAANSGSTTVSGASLSTGTGHGEGSVTAGKDGTALSVGLVVNF